MTLAQEAFHKTDSQLTPRGLLFTLLHQTALFHCEESDARVCRNLYPPLPLPGGEFKRCAGMREFNFFDELKQYFESHPHASDFEKYVAIPASGGVPERSVFYTAFLEKLLYILEIPTAPGSPHQELRPLYHLIHKIDPHYFTEGLISEEVLKCYTLSSLQQEQMRKWLAMFFKTLGRSPLFNSTITQMTKEDWEAWYQVLPEGHAWDFLKMLQGLGIQVIASWQGYRAWYRFRHGRSPSEKDTPRSWEQLCEQWAETQGQLKHYPDLLADGFAGGLSHLGIQGVCGDTPDCVHCPLQTACCWHQAAAQSSEEESLLAQIQKAQFDELSIPTLMGWLFSLDDWEYPALEAFFPKETPLRSLDQKTTYELGQVRPDLPYFGEKLKVFLELCKRYNEEKLTPGDQFSCSADIFQHFRFSLRDLKQEVFILVLLDNKHQYLTESVITKGTLNKSLVHPREVFSAAIENRAAAIICVHNHPSGDPKASQEDIQITRRLLEVGTVVGIPLLDHVIIGNDRYFSLADQGLL